MKDPELKELWTKELTPPSFSKLCAELDEISQLQVPSKLTKPKFRKASALIPITLCFVVFISSVLGRNEPSFYDPQTADILATMTNSDYLNVYDLNLEDELI